MFGREEKVSTFRLTAVQYVILAIFLVLAYRLWRLQVMQSDEYALLAEKNRVRNVPILAPRGKILDREGRIIVDNYPSFSALLLRDSTRDLNADADAIAKGLHLNPDEVRQRIKRTAWMPQYQPIFLKEDITPDELAFIEAHKNELPELETIMSHRRLYPRNGFMAHLIGYVGEVTRRHAQPAAVRTLYARRRGRREWSREAVQQHPDGQERIRGARSSIATGAKSGGSTKRRPSPASS